MSTTVRSVVRLGAVGLFGWASVHQHRCHTILKQLCGNNCIVFLVHAMLASVASVQCITAYRTYYLFPRLSSIAQRVLLQLTAVPHVCCSGSRVYLA